VGRQIHLGLRCGEGRLWAAISSHDHIPEPLAVQWPPEAVRYWK
jgi:hypothetical protein